MEVTRRIGEVLTREGKAQKFRRATARTGGSARGEQASQRRLPRRQRAFLLRALRSETGDRLARLAGAGLQRMQSPVGIGNRTLRVAQRIARFPLVGLPALEFAAQRFDARAQGGKVFLFGGGRRRARGERQDERRDPDQDLALPWAATAARRFSTSAASPR
jgi:hypothetical protein